MMHRISRIFATSPNRRKTGSRSGSSASSSSSRLSGKPKPRLERLNARRDIDYEFCPSPTSPSNYFFQESKRSHSRYFLEGKKSFRIDGSDSEIEAVCEMLGFSGIDDLAISTEEYAAMKVRFSPPAAAFSQKIEPNLLDQEIEFNCAEVLASGKIRGDCVQFGLGEDSDDVTSIKREGGREFGNIERNKANVVCSILVDSTAKLTDVISSDNVIGKFNEYRGHGIKGERPPLLLSLPTKMPLPRIDKNCSTWDILRAYASDNDEADNQMMNEDEGCEEYRRRGAVGREENFMISGSCSFTTASNDDDSSSTTTDPMSSVSPNGGFGHIILEWQKGDLLGRGSFGSVYEGIAEDGFFFAVKEVSLLDQGAEGKQRIIQLEQEIALLRQFEHENIVQYYGTIKDETHLYIFLELVTKGSLLSLYQTYNLRDSQVSAYTRQILIGLKYLHDRNVVHRDIKCANILVDASGLVKLADFGLAKTIKLNDVKSCKGTAFWMAPEVVRSRGYGLAADIWSLGCTVLEMLTRRFPYYDLECMAALFRIGNGNRPTIPDSLSSDARDFILQCLQVDPNLRPKAAELLDHPFVKQPLPSPFGFPSPRYFGRQF